MPYHYVSSASRRPLGPLEDDLSRLVTDRFAREADMPEDASEQALTLFDRLKAEGLWLRCACAGDRDAGPILTPVYPSRLRRLPNPNPEHSPTWPFARDRAPREAVTYPGRERLPDQQLALHGAFLDGGGGTPIGGAAIRRPRPPRISRILFTALAEAGINRDQHGSNPEAAQQSLRLWRAARQLVLAQHAGHRVLLSAFLATITGEGIGTGRIITLKDEISRCEHWPQGSRPQGFLIGVFTTRRHDRDRGRYELLPAGWKNPIFIDVKPSVFAEGSTFDRSPYIGVVSYTAVSRTENAIHGIRSFLQPCMGEDDWFPVDSGNERRTLAIMRDWRRSLGPNWTIDIEKPLFDTTVEMGGSQRPVRPDFILDARGPGGVRRTVAVETMGSEDGDYIDSKRRTHPAMVARWGLLVQHRCEARSTRGREAARGDLVSDFDLAALQGEQPAYETLRAAGPDPARGGPTGAGGAGS